MVDTIVKYCREYKLDIFSHYIKKEENPVTCGDLLESCVGLSLVLHCYGKKIKDLPIFKNIKFIDENATFNIKNFKSYDKHKLSYFLSDSSNLWKEMVNLIIKIYLFIR